MFSEDINIKKILFNKFNTLGRLCARTKKNNLINQIVSSYINSVNPDIAKNCRVSNLADNYLYIETNRSEYLTQLRFMTTDLLSQLRQQPELYQLIGIKFKVNPSWQPEIKHSDITHKTNITNKLSEKSSPISSATANNLQEIASNIKNSKLKQALLKLTKR